MTQLFNKALDILLADTDDLNELMKIGGGNSETFFVGQDFGESDLRTQDLVGLCLHASDLSRCQITPEQHAELSARNEDIKLPELEEQAL